MIIKLVVKSALALVVLGWAASEAVAARETREIVGWQVHIDERLLAEHAAATAKALGLLQGQ